jgi:hypothetical protein
MSEDQRQRVEQQLAELKASAHYRGQTAQIDRLRAIEERIDWQGVSSQDKEAVLAKEVNFREISRDQLNTMYAELGFDDIGQTIDFGADERPGRRLFDKANFERAKTDPEPGGFAEQLAQARATTRGLVTAVLADTWPSVAAVTDFGLESQRHYEALYHPIRNGEMRPAVLDAAMGFGEALTELAWNAPSNPHKDIRFHTAWDDMLGRGRPQADAKTAKEPSPAPDPARRAQFATRDPDQGHDR